MTRDRLSIPLSENPTRQIFGRVFGVTIVVVLVMVAAYVIDRAYLFRSGPPLWPAGATTAVRVIKTPRTAKLIEDNFGTVPALTGAPWTIHHVMEWTKREAILFTDGEQVVGIKVDGPLSNDTLASLTTWGFKTVEAGSAYFIVAEQAPELERTSATFTPAMLLPMFHGNVALRSDTDIQVLPFRLRAGSVDFRLKQLAFVPEQPPVLAVETDLSGLFHLPAELASGFLPTNIPAAFPGLQRLSVLLHEQGADVAIGTDKVGQVFALAIPNSTLSLPELEELAIEVLNLQSLSVRDYTYETLPEAQEIIALEEPILDVTENNGLITITAQDSDGQLIRLSQTTERLLISNRASVIGLESAIPSTACLDGTVAFLQPRELESWFTPQSGVPTDLLTHLAHAQELATRNHTVRLCL